MKVIKPASDDTLKILSAVRKGNGRARLMKYCVSEQIKNGTLIYNLLTGELIFIEKGENALLIPELKDRLFFVPEETDEREYVDLVRLVLRSVNGTYGFTDYEIFTTTDCNARCFYCYEKGRSRIAMSDEIADKTADFIINNSTPEKSVNIRWFGGEPLFNKRAIERICAKLKSNNTAFSSHIVSNGYLFDNDTVDQAVTDWNLKTVQITLDGTEKVYNNTKAYIYRDVNPYITVINNIKCLLENGIKVNIRLNIGPYNKDELFRLAAELNEFFYGRQKPYVYVHPLYDVDDPRGAIDSGDIQKSIYTAVSDLKEKLGSYGLYRPGKLKNTVALFQCGADSGRRITVLPGGEIGLCENFSESEFIGDLDNGVTNKNIYSSWHEYCETLPECNDCFYYPQCLRLKKCKENARCFEELRSERLKDIKISMKYAYEHFVEKGCDGYNDTEVC